ncbi:MAG: hypothetical protein ABIJ09_24300 [Pseudomonadota bacterium]
MSLLNYRADFDDDDVRLRLLGYRTARRKKFQRIETMLRTKGLSLDASFGAELGEVTFKLAALEELVLALVGPVELADEEQPAGEAPGEEDVP